MNPGRKLKYTLLTVLCLAGISLTCYAQEFRDPDLDNTLKKIKAVYRINLHYAEGPETKPADLDYSLADPEDSQALKKVILLFAREISLYPKDFFREADCRNIYFVQKLFYKQKPADGLFEGGANDIFYDYSRCNENTQKIRHYIHHELYHMIGSRHPFWREHGPAWVALNRPGFSYNPKYSPHEANPINFYAPPEPGFITDYAMASAEEDRAEVFACMMLPEEHDLMKQWAQKDKILSHKVEMMEEFLRKIF